MDANEPFLPPRQHSDYNAVQPAPKQAKRTLLLWLLLIVMFLGIYWLFNDPKPHRRAAPPRDASCAPCEKSNPLYPWLPSLGFGFLIFFFLRRQFRGGTKFNERLEPGLLALADGSFAQAAELLRAVEAQYTKNTSYAAAAALSLADAQIHQGALAQAIQTLARAERGAGLMYGSDVRIQAAIDLTRAYALRGETEVAERWAADVRKRL